MLVPWDLKPYDVLLAFGLKPCVIQETKYWLQPYVMQKYHVLKPYAVLIEPRWIEALLYAESARFETLCYIETLSN